MSKSNTVRIEEGSANNETQTPAATTTDKKEVTGYDLKKLMSEHKSKSSVIRFLAAQGYSRGAIAKFMDIRYQHVRTVLVTPLKGSAS